MEIKQFLDARFLVPPAITIFFLWLANPPDFLDYILKYQGVGGFLTGTTFIFALGFLISSFVTFFVIKLFGLRATLKEYKEEDIEKIFPFLNKPLQGIDKEAATWFAILDEKN